MASTVLITHQSIGVQEQLEVSLNTLTPSNLANTGNYGQREGEREGESNIEHMHSR